MVITVVLVVLICLFFAEVIWWYGSIPAKLPPGPTGLPFLGSALDTWNASSILGKLLDWTKKYGPIFKFYVGNRLVIVLSNWDSIQEAFLKQGDAYNGRASAFALLPDDLNRNKLLGSTGKSLDLEQELMRMQRRFMLSTIHESTGRESNLELNIKTEASHLVKALAMFQGHSLDPAQWLICAGTNVQCMFIFGKRFEYEDKRLISFVKAQTAMFTGTDVGGLSLLALSKQFYSIMTYCCPLVKRMKQANHEWVMLIRPLLKEAMNKPIVNGEPSNYIEAFINAQAQANRSDNWTFTTEALLASIIAIWLAGAHSVPHVLRWLLFQLAKKPSMQDAIYEEISRAIQFQDDWPTYKERAKFPTTEAVIAEALRLHNPSPFGVPRKTIAPSTLCGFDIPAGAVVVSLSQALMADPKVFPQPDQFDSSHFRKNGKITDDYKQFIPFGLGKRRCPGEILAKMELFIFLTALVSKYKFCLPISGKGSLAKDIRKPGIQVPNPIKICFEARAEYIDRQ